MQNEVGGEPMAWAGGGIRLIEENMVWNFQGCHCQRNSMDLTKICGALFFCLMKFPSQARVIK